MTGGVVDVVSGGGGSEGSGAEEVVGGDKSADWVRESGEVLVRGGRVGEAGHSDAGAAFAVVEPVESGLVGRDEGRAGERERA